MEAVALAALEGGAEVGSTVAVRGGLSGSSPLPKVVLEGEGEDVVVVVVEEVVAPKVVAVAPKVAAEVGSCRKGGGAAGRLVVEVVCVAVLEVGVCAACVEEVL